MPVEIGNVTPSPLQSGDSFIANREGFPAQVVLAPKFEAIETSVNDLWIESDTKQDVLVSGVNIKTVGGVSIVGGGDVPLAVPPDPDWGEIGGTLSAQTDLQTALNGKAATVHTHVEADVTGLTASLAGKAASSHTHPQSDVTGLVAALSGKAETAHTHVEADITGLGTSLAGKANLVHTHAIGDVTGLGALASLDLVTSAYLAANSVTASEIATGAVGNSEIGPLAVSNSKISDGAVGTIKLADGAATNAKLANMGSGRIKGRVSGGTGDPEDLTNTQVKTLLAIAEADVSGLATSLAGKAPVVHTHPTTDITGLGTLATLNTVSTASIQDGAVTSTKLGDAAVTAAKIEAGAVTTVKVIDGAITNAKMANMATATIKGRTTAGTGVVEDLTPTQATALLNTVTTALKGLAPASGGGTANYLRADGTWATPPTGGVTDGDKGDIVVSGGGSVWTIDASAVDTTELANDAVTAAKIATGAVGTSELAAEAVDEARLKDDSISTIKLKNNAVDNSKLANMPTQTIKGRITAGTFDPEDLTAAQVKTILDISTADISDLADFPNVLVQATAPVAPDEGILWYRNVAPTGLFMWSDDGAGSWLPISPEDPLVFFPEQYGAVGDGVTDDGPAFAAMVTAIIASAKPASILLRAKDYYVNQQIDFTLMEQPISISGVRGGATILRAGDFGCTQALLKMSEAERWTITDLDIRSKAGTDRRDHPIAIYSPRSSQYLIRSVQVQSLGNTAFWASSAYNGQMQEFDCQLTGYQPLWKEIPSGCTASLSLGSNIVNTNIALFDAGDVGKELIVQLSEFSATNRFSNSGMIGTITAVNTATQIVWSATSPVSDSGLQLGFTAIRGSMSAGSTLLTAEKAMFDPSEVGRYVYLLTGQEQNRMHVTTIASYVSPTQVNLADAAEVAVVSQRIYLTPVIYHGPSNLADTRAVNDVVWTDTRMAQCRGPSVILNKGLHVNITNLKTHGKSWGDSTEIGYAGHSFILSGTNRVTVQGWEHEFHQGGVNTGPVCVNGTNPSFSFSEITIAGCCFNAHWLDFTADDDELSMGYIGSILTIRGQDHWKYPFGMFKVGSNIKRRLHVAPFIGTGFKADPADLMTSDEMDIAYLPTPQSLVQISSGIGAIRYRETTGDYARATPDGRLWAPDGPVYPEHFKAVGDGVTDDTAAMQAWATYIGGREGFLTRSKVYKVTEEIVIGEDDTRVNGPGVLKQATWGLSGFVVTGNNCHFDNVTVLSSETKTSLSTSTASRHLGDYAAIRSAGFYTTGDDCTYTGCIVDGFVAGFVAAGQRVWRTNVTIAGATTTTFPLNAGDVQAEDFYNGMVIRVFGGADSKEKLITNYVNATNTITIDGSWTAANNGAGIYYVIYKATQKNTRLNNFVQKNTDAGVALGWVEGFSVDGMTSFNGGATQASQIPVGSLTTIREASASRSTNVSLSGAETWGHPNAAAYDITATDNVVMSSIQADKCTSIAVLRRCTFVTAAVFVGTNLGEGNDGSPVKGVEVIGGKSIQVGDVTVQVSPLYIKGVSGSITYDPVGLYVTSDLDDSGPEFIAIDISYGSVYMEWVPADSQSLITYALRCRRTTGGITTPASIRVRGNRAFVKAFGAATAVRYGDATDAFCGDTYARSTSAAATLFASIDSTSSTCIVLYDWTLNPATTFTNSGTNCVVNPINASILDTYRPKGQLVTTGSGITVETQAMSTWNLRADSFQSLPNNVRWRAGGSGDTPNLWQLWSNTDSATNWMGLNPTNCQLRFGGTSMALQSSDGTARLTVGNTGNVTVNTGNLIATVPGPYANDAAASAGGVAIGQLYRVTGGAISWRQV